MIAVIKRKSILYVYFFLTNPDLTSYKPRFDFLQTPTYFLQTPSYKIIFLDLFKMYVSVYQFIIS